MIAKMPKIETEKDELYRLEEMLDEMKKSKDNAENVIKSQMELIDFVKANDTENKFEEFVKAMDEQTISTENAIKTLTVPRYSSGMYYKVLDDRCYLMM